MAGGDFAKAADNSSGDASSWTAAVRLEAVIATAAMDAAMCAVRCPEQGLFPADLDVWTKDAAGDQTTPRRRRQSESAAESRNWSGT